MSEEIKQIPLGERWKMEIESYKRAAELGLGVKVDTAFPLGESCVNFVLGDAFH